MIADIAAAVAVLAFMFTAGMVTEVRLGGRRRAANFETDRAELYAAALENTHDTMRDERDQVLAAEDDNLATWLAKSRGELGRGEA